MSATHREMVAGSGGDTSGGAHTHSEMVAASGGDTSGGAHTHMCPHRHHEKHESASTQETTQRRSRS